MIMENKLRQKRMENACFHIVCGPLFGFFVNFLVLNTIFVCLLTILLYQTQCLMSKKHMPISNDYLRLIPLKYSS